MLFDYVVDDAGVPMIPQAPVSMVCSVEDIYNTKGFESFICTIDATYAEENVLNEAGKLDYRILKPVLLKCLLTSTCAPAMSSVIVCLMAGNRKNEGISYYIVFLYRSYPSDRAGNSYFDRRRLVRDLSLAAISDGVSGTA